MVMRLWWWQGVTEVMFEDVIMETFTTISTDLSSTVVELKVREEAHAGEAAAP